jgi:leader peptidase (prepilin peptidase)/N-methyltransferase
MLVLIPILLCWGSFLNALSYRLIRSKSIVKPRSQCTTCHHQLAWYDLIPLISWVMLRGKCRYCHAKISPLYPFIEILTPLIMVPLFLSTPAIYLPAYFIFFSALIVTIRSDFDTMLISRFVTLFLIPVGLLFSATNLLPITVLNSLIGALCGYGFLVAIGYFFKAITGKEGMGQGDVELLSFIGSFTGILGCWLSLLVGSILGSIYGIMYITFITKKRTAKIPFGPFLAGGAICYVLAHKYLIALLLL